MTAKKTVLFTSGLCGILAAACMSETFAEFDTGSTSQALSPVPYAPPKALPPTLSDRQTWLESVGDVATMRKELREDLRVLRDNPVIAHGYTLRKYSDPQVGDVYEQFEGKTVKNIYGTTRTKHALNLIAASDDPEFRLGSKAPSGSVGALFGGAPFVPQMATLPPDGIAQAGDLQQIAFMGTRLGYSRAKIRIEHQDVNFRSEPIEEFQARLDPDVLLVPVRVFVIVDKADSTRMLETHSLSNQMRFWDGGFAQDAGPVITYGASAASGPTLAMTQEVPARATRTVTTSSLGVDELKQDIRKSYPSPLSPDDVFGACGVQFRLVDHQVVVREPKFSFPLSKLNAKPEDPVYWADTTPDETPCSNNADYISKNYANPYSTLDMIVMSRVSFPTNKIIGLASTGTPACLKQSYDPKSESYALAHEIGHVAGLKHCSGKTSDCRLMPTEAYTQAGPPSASECTAVRAWAFNRAKSFPGFSATQP